MESGHEERMGGSGRVVGYSDVALSFTDAILFSSKTHRNAGFSLNQVDARSTAGRVCIYMYYGQRNQKIEM